MQLGSIILNKRAAMQQASQCFARVDAQSLDYFEQFLFFCIFMKCFSSLGLIRMMIVDVELHGERMLSFEGKWCYRHSKILIDTHVPESTG